MNKIWKIAHDQSINLDDGSVIMGILNLTPDSFSDGGAITSQKHALATAKQMILEGAKIIDVGGESTRPGAIKISVEEEQARIIPVIERLSNEDIIISVDTYHARTARAALQAGAHIINDVWGLQKESEIAEIAADYGAGLVIMHTSRDRNYVSDVIDDQKIFFEKSLEIAEKARIKTSALMLDPGFGFGKNFDMNMTLMARARELNTLGYPWLVGTSRKRFLGEIMQQENPQKRDIATAATSVLLRDAGASVFRVHNVAINRDALSVADAVCQRIKALK